MTPEELAQRVYRSLDALADGGPSAQDAVRIAGAIRAGMAVERQAFVEFGPAVQLCAHRRRQAAFEFLAYCQGMAEAIFVRRAGEVVRFADLTREEQEDCARDWSDPNDHWDE